MGLADPFGAHGTGPTGGERAVTGQTLHSYLRLNPELRADLWGPATGDEPRRRSAIRFCAASRKPISCRAAVPGAAARTSWMRQLKTDIPGLVLNRRVAFLPADIDRLYARGNLPDHAALLANLVRCAANDDIPL